MLLLAEQGSTPPTGEACPAEEEEEEKTCRIAATLVVFAAAAAPVVVTTVRGDGHGGRDTDGRDYSTTALLPSALTRGAEGTVQTGRRRKKEETAAALVASALSLSTLLPLNPIPFQSRKQERKRDQAPPLGH